MSGARKRQRQQEQEEAIEQEAGNDEGVLQERAARREVMAEVARR